MNSFGTLKTLDIDGTTYSYHSLPDLARAAGIDLDTLPYSTKILLENLLRHEDGEIVRKTDIEAVLLKKPTEESEYEIQFTPARVLLQDFTGVPVVADLAAMRDGMIKRGGNPDKVNPLRPVDLVIDHSVQMDFSGEADALKKNVAMEFERNGERYEFLKWGQKAFENFRVVPPATGICHQINLESLSHVAMTGKQNGTQFIFPDTLVGTDSHTTMINGLGVVGWGVGGIEAEAAMLGQPCTMLIPQVVGVELKGRLKPGATATDLVLRITEILRKKGVVGKFVEYYGEGVSMLSIADRATVSNMSPEYGATIGVFPVDEKTVGYLRATGREEKARKTEAYYKQQGLWGLQSPKVKFSDTLSLDLATVEPSMAGPARPQDRVLLNGVRGSFRKFLLNRYKDSLASYSQEMLKEWSEMSDSMKGISWEKADFVASESLGPLGAYHKINGPKGSYHLVHGSIVIAAITSCTNTSNPALMLGAALLARNAVAKGLRSQPWVKTSFAPGSIAVRDYIESAGLMEGLNTLGFQIAGFGCATCIGNSGPLPPEIQEAIEKSGLATAAVLSGNRNFEARIHPFVMGNYLASPLLVVAAAIAGNINVNLADEPLGLNAKGEAVYLKDIWPDPKELEEVVLKNVTAQQFSRIYKDVFAGDKNWQAIQIPEESSYKWSDSSTYIKQPPFVMPEMSKKEADIHGARILAIFGDSITTDHISPAGNIGAKSPAGKYLTTNGVQPVDFNSYGSRRGNHEVMVRGTFANVRIKNRLASKEGGFTVVYPEKQETTIFEAAELYRTRKVPLVIFAGKEYGSGSSRDWAAKGTRLLGVRAVIAESFERIHRSNLVGMGVLPLQITADSLAALKLQGDEEIDFPTLVDIKPRAEMTVTVRGAGGSRQGKVLLRIDTPNELKYFNSGGILPYVLSRLEAQA
jgi:aconitate hydratase